MKKFTPFTAALSALLFTTAIQAKDIDTAQDQGAVNQQELAEMYNSHFDFARSMHTLNLSSLIQQQIAKPVQDDKYSQSYKLNFDQSYVDVYGNRYSGEIVYQQTDIDKKVGTVERMEFNNFYINDIKVNGVKYSKVTAMQDDVVRRVDWCNKCAISADVEPEQTLTMEFANGQTMALEGIFTKQIGYDDFGQKQVLITGTAQMNLNNKKYNFSVKESMLMTGNCRWMESGKVTVTDSAQQSVGVITLDNPNCSSQYQLASANGQTTVYNRHHNLWK